jgi:asparagine synthase (glutamine-hydrolysing)
MARGSTLMCGILGWLGDQHSLDAGRFDAALDLLAHRGPDDRGVYADAWSRFGHRRLSIVDLSPNGHQPMVDAASNAVLVFNGEIYNHVELRAELAKLGHRFVGHSDTEVLLHALLEWDEAALPRLNGMWAFAFWQPARHRLFLSRDRFGVKPLYFCETRDGLAFASEPKALLALFPKHRAVNERALLDFLAHNTLQTGDESFYPGIRIFPSAHCAHYDPEHRSLRFNRFWRYPERANESLRADEAVAQFDALFADAVRLRLRSDVGVGVTLSGGLDSTAVLTAACLSGVSAPVSFTSVYGAGETGELSWAQRASAPLRSTLLAVEAPEDDWLVTLRQIAWHLDGPGYSPAVYPLWHLMRRARTERVPVLLEGQGADEALAGYPQYAVLELLRYIGGRARPEHGRPHHPYRGLVDRLRAMRRAHSVRTALAWTVRELSPTVLRWHRQSAGFQSLLRSGVSLPDRPQAVRAADPVRQRLLADHASDILPGLLHYGDAISMAHGVEARNPFLDFRLVEWMFTLPAGLRFENGESKWVLREYLRNHKQAEIGNRPDKRGYPTPVGRWLASNRDGEIERLLLGPNSVLSEWCDPAKIKRLIARNRSGAFGAEHSLYKLLSTQLWFEQCIEGGALK